MNIFNLDAINTDLQLIQVTIDENVVVSKTDATIPQILALYNQDTKKTPT